MSIVTELPATAAPDAEDGLAARFRAGDAAAFEAIVERHRRTVYAVARRLLGNHDDADEATQRAFVRAWRARESFRGEAAIGTWLVRIAINVARNLAGRRPPTTALEAAPEPRVVGPDAEAALLRSRERRRLRRAVAALPPRQREVLVLKVYTELTHRDVARALGVTEGTAKAHLHQAVANLRRALGDTADEEARR